MQKRNDRGFADGVMELRLADKAATLYDMEGKVGSSKSTPACRKRGSWCARASMNHSANS